MALTANYVPKYKGLVSSHPQLENSSIYDDGSTTTTKGRNVAFVIKTTTPYTVLTTDDVVVCNVAVASDGSGIVINLPAAAGTGRKIVVKNINSRHVEVTPNGTDTIDDINSAAVVGFLGSVTVLDYASGKWTVLY